MNQVIEVDEELNFELNEVVMASFEQLAPGSNLQIIAERSDESDSWKY